VVCTCTPKGATHVMHDECSGYHNVQDAGSSIQALDLCRKIAASGYLNIQKAKSSDKEDGYLIHAYSAITLLSFSLCSLSPDFSPSYRILVKYRKPW